MSQDLDDLFITETDRAQRLHVGIAHLTAVIDELEREAQCGLCLGIR